MKKENSILIAFLLNLFFAVFEFAGGIVTGSVAVVSDAVHDLGDAVSIGISCLLERRSRRAPDRYYTYGHGRYSVIGGAITTLILLIGSLAVIYNAILRLLDPAPIHYDGMLLMACIGVAVNFAAAWATRRGHSLNQKAVNLHMLEDVLGWLVVLAGAMIMRFTNLALLDPLMSIGVALFIGFHGAKHLRQVLEVVLEKAPRGLDAETVRSQLAQLEGVLDVHHLHIWTLDGHLHCATVHIVTNTDPHGIKDKVRHRMEALGVAHVTVETETAHEHCHHKACALSLQPHSHHHHHH